jgi:hypothetical protein
VNQAGLWWKKSEDFYWLQILHRTCITNPLVVHGLSIGVKTPGECFGQGFEPLIECLHLAEFEYESSLQRAAQLHGHDCQRDDQSLEKNVGCTCE